MDSCLGNPFPSDPMESVPPRPVRNSILCCQEPIKFDGLLLLYIHWGRDPFNQIPTGPTAKSGPLQNVDPFFRNFSGWTKPIHWSVLHGNFRKCSLNGSPLLKSLENWLPVSLVVQGLRQSDSVWVYWTTLHLKSFTGSWLFVMCEDKALFRGRKYPRIILNGFLNHNSV